MNVQDLLRLAKSNFRKPQKVQMHHTPQLFPPPFRRGLQDVKLEQPIYKVEILSIIKSKTELQGLFNVNLDSCIKTPGQ